MDIRDTIKDMTKEEILSEIDNLEEAMFLEQMRDYMDHDWYRKARERLNIFKEELNKRV